MNYYFQLCATARYQERYISFMLEHYKELNLPYPFPVSLSFIASPILMKEDAILFFDSDDEIAGALGFIYGTGDNNYQDTHIVQIQTIFIVEQHRRTRLLLEAIQYLTQFLEQTDKNVTELRFWTPAEDGLRRLCAKLAKREAVMDTALGSIDEYRASLAHWHDYGMRFRHLMYFET
ncbi:hypothetical protein [Paenibacillus mendelii]|uniref:N-acetyltransferase domain-containing protein n=1 Tax=Paenibacillus mendelii TaxID=206163 RepID=A0ABV6JL16_9BACL|nr:hypothetical protein [Paenibacillus mendelii]MCQ6562368.1 hypothetical protein [Paenibacillus mendelii]